MALEHPQFIGFAFITHTLCFFWQRTACPQPWLGLLEDEFDGIGAFLRRVSFFGWSGQ
jgi:hypothetical protein